MREIHILLWSYSDKSGSGAVRAYDSLSHAQNDLELMEKYSDRKFEIQTVEFIDSIGR